MRQEKKLCENGIPHFESPMTASNASPCGNGGQTTQKQQQTKIGRTCLLYDHGKIQPELIIRSTEVDYYDLQKIDYDNQQLIKIYTYNYDLHNWLYDLHQPDDFKQELGYQQSLSQLINEKISWKKRRKIVKKRKISSKRG